MRIIVIRHGESEGDVLNVHEGRADFNLTEKGHLQAKAMAEYVSKNYNIDKIYVSTLKRAVQTATHLSEKIAVPIILDDNLMEFNNGLIAGLSWEEADEKYPKVENLPIDQSVYGQESRVEFRKRAENAFERILNENDSNSTVAIVSHGGMINQLYHVFLGLPIESKIFFGTGDTGIHEWIIKGERYILRANYEEHGYISSIACE
ncbi:MAG: histidine phosphatase family protein [Agathobacter sp.]|nr:histidine phosphatase family protein [Agathobacter sp.]